MLTWQETIGLDLPPRETFPSFRAYLEAAEELFIESMQDAADNKWHEIRSRMEAAPEEAIGADMERWWDGQIRRFRTRAWKRHFLESIKQLNREKRREEIRLIHAQEQLEAAQVENERLRCDLAGAETLADYLAEQRRCRNCDGELGN